MRNYDDDEEIKAKERKRMITINSLNKVTRGNYSGITIVDNAINNFVKRFKRKCKTHFGIELTINPSSLNPNDTSELYKWISMNCPVFAKKYDNLCKRRIKEGKNTIDTYIENDSFFFKVDEATYVSIKIGQDYADYITNSSNMSKLLFSDIRIAGSDIYMYIFGRHAYKYAILINSIIDGREENTFRMYNVHGEKSSHSDVAFKSLYQDMEKREMNTIFMEPGIIESIEEHIDKYLSNKDLYSGRGIVYKTGILLYGEPGTGKTSLLKALASKYNYDLILIDMTTFDNIALETLTHSLNIDDEKYIIALEDIDCVIANREDENADKDDKKIINKLLQFLDSNSSPNEVIFIATTNHLELLDEALMREGRFDLKVEIGGIKRNKVIEMCKSFNLDDSQINDILKQISDMGIDLSKQTIRQSKLQSMILKSYSGLNLKAEGDDDLNTDSPKEEYNGDNQ